MATFDELTAGTIAYNDVFAFRDISAASQSLYTKKCAPQEVLKVVCVDWYGAEGDGTTDDTTAISDAITAAGEGGVVYFTPGKTYKTTSQIAVSTDHSVFWGYGAAITSATENQFRKFSLTSRAGVAFYGLRFDCLHSAASGVLGQGAVEISGSTDITVKDCSFNDIAGSGVYVVGAAERVKIVNNTFYRTFCSIFADDNTTVQPLRLLISGNQFRTGLGAVSTSYSGAIKISGVGSANSYAGHVITDNTIVSPGEMGIELQTWVNGCVIGNNNIYGAGFGISISGCADIAISGNNLKACTAYAIEVTGVVAGGNEARNVAVSGGSINGANTSGTVVTDYGVYVGAAIGVTVDGVTVTECLSNEIAVVDAVSVSVNGCRTVGDGYLLKNSSIVTISGCVINAGTAPNYFIFVDSNDLAVSKVNVTGNTFAGTVANNGVLLYSPANSITDVVIANNVTTSASATGWMYSTTVSGGGSVSRVSIFDNIGTGEQAFQNNFNIGVYALSSNTTLDPKYETVLVDASGGAVTITLPSGDGIDGKPYTVVKTDSSGNAVSVSTTSSQTINGSAPPYSLASQYKRVTVKSDGANWFITQSN